MSHDVNVELKTNVQVLGFTPTLLRQDLSCLCSCAEHSRRGGAGQQAQQLPCVSASHLTGGTPGLTRTSGSLGGLWRPQGLSLV